MIKSKYNIQVCGYLTETKAAEAFRVFKCSSVLLDTDLK